MNVHLKKLTNESKEKPEQKFDAALGAKFWISKCFSTVLGIRDILVRIGILGSDPYLWLLDPDPTPVFMDFKDVIFC